METTFEKTMKRGTFWKRPHRQFLEKNYRSGILMEVAFLWKRLLKKLWNVAFFGNGHIGNFWNWKEWWKWHFLWKRLLEKTIKCGNFWKRPHRQFLEKIIELAFFYGNGHIGNFWKKLWRGIFLWKRPHRQFFGKKD